MRGSILAIQHVPTDTDSTDRHTHTHMNSPDRTHDSLTPHILNIGEALGALTVPPIMRTVKFIYHFLSGVYCSSSSPEAR